MILNRLCFSGRCTAVACVVSSLFILCVPITHDQASKVAATLEGTVSDSSGAVVPGAGLTVTNTLTNQVRSVTTNDQGFFRASQLPVGTYKVGLAHPGFSLYERKDIALGLGQTV